MNESKTHQITTLNFSQKVNEYYKLCKPNVVALLILTAIVGMLLASPTLERILWVNFIFGIIGITLASASAAVINQILDQRYDEGMVRTKNRPLPTGSVTQNQAFIFAICLGLVGESLLYFIVNPLTALLTFIALIGYAYVYTVFLKHATPQNIVIGGASGAAPPVLGWVAMTGEITVEPLILFLIIFIWTPPHFWALSIHRKDDYAKVNIPMLPVTHGTFYTKQQVLMYKILLLVISVLPFVIGMSGWLYLTAALGLGGWYLYYAVIMLTSPDKLNIPMRSFVVSIWYLLFIFLALLIDHYAVAYWGELFGQKIPYTN